MIRLLAMLGLFFSIHSSFAGYVIYQHPIHQIIDGGKLGYATGLYDGNEDRAGKKEAIAFLRQDGNFLKIRATGGYEVWVEYFTESSAQTAFAKLKNPKLDLSIDVSDCESWDEKPAMNGQGSCNDGSSDKCFTLSYNVCGYVDRVNFKKSSFYADEGKYPTVNLEKTVTTYREFAERVGGRM